MINFQLINLPRGPSSAAPILTGRIQQLYVFIQLYMQLSAWLCVRVLRILAATFGCYNPKCRSRHLNNFTQKYYESPLSNRVEMDQDCQAYATQNENFKKNVAQVVVWKITNFDRQPELFNGTSMGAITQRFSEVRQLNSPVRTGWHV